MPTPPRFSLSPEDAKWGRWVTEQLQKLSGETKRAATNIKAANQGAASSVGANAVTRVQVTEVAETVEGIGDIIIAPTPPLAPTAPTLTTGMSTVVASWDGLLAQDVAVDPEDPETPVEPLLLIPTSGFKGVIAEVSTIDPDDELVTPDWTQVGVGRPDAGGISFSRSVGETVWVRLVASNYDGAQSEPSGFASIVVEGIAIPDFDPNVDVAQLIQANSILAEMVQMNEGFADKFWANEGNFGKIGVDFLTPSFGEDLNISANGSIILSLGNAANASDAAVAATNQAIAAGAANSITAQRAAEAAASAAEAISATQDLSRRFSFTETDLRIQQPGSPAALSVSDTGIAFLQNDVPVSLWDGGQMIVKSFVGEEVVLANHKIETSGARTIVRSM